MSTMLEILGKRVIDDCGTRDQEIALAVDWADASDPIAMEKLFVILNDEFTALTFLPRGADQGVKMLALIGLHEVAKAYIQTKGASK